MRGVILIALGVGLLTGCSRGEGPGIGPLAVPVSPVGREYWRNPDALPDRKAAEARRNVSVYPPRNARPPAATFSSYDGVPAAVPADDEPEEKASGDVPARDIVDVGLSRKPKEPPRKAAVYPQPGVDRTPRPPRRPVLATPEPPVRPTAVASLQPAEATPQPSPSRQVAEQEPDAEEAATTPPQSSQQVAALIPGPSPVLKAPKAPTLTQPVATRDASPELPPSMAYGEAFGGNKMPLAKVPSSLGLANIETLEAAPVARGGLERARADASGAVAWDDAVALLKAGEVQSYTKIGGKELFVILCSGRGVMTEQPREDAILEVSPPKIICGREAALTGE